MCICTQKPQFRFFFLRDDAKLHLQNIQSSFNTASQNHIPEKSKVSFMSTRVCSTRVCRVPPRPLHLSL